jgi:peptide/nickel transport system permease protein
MIRYLSRRVVLLLPALFALSLATFFLLRLIPGDPAQVMLGEHATAEQIARFRASSGLDQPLPVQYLRYLGDLLRGDWGRAIRTNLPVTAELGQRLPATIELSLAAMAIACTLGIPAGALAAYRRHSWPDRFASVITLLGVSVPLFWLGLLLSYLFGYWLGWVPPSGRLSIRSDLQEITGLYVLDSILTANLHALGDSLRHLVLPALTLATVPLAIIARMTRSTLLDALAQDYVRTARAKGLRERTVLLGHAMRNAAPPVLTVIGWQLGLLFSGAILTETIFSWPGMGQYVVDCVLGRDYPAVQGVVLVIVLLFVGVNLVTDLCVAGMDPRVRHG